MFLIISFSKNILLFAALKKLLKANLHVLNQQNVKNVLYVTSRDFQANWLLENMNTLAGLSYYNMLLNPLW